MITEVVFVIFTQSIPSDAKTAEVTEDLQQLKQEMENVTRRVQLQEYSVLETESEYQEDTTYDYTERTDLLSGHDNVRSQKGPFS